MRRKAPCAPCYVCHCRTNLAFYAALLGVGAAGLLLLLASGRLQPSNILGLLIAASNAYGLIACGCWAGLAMGKAAGLLHAMPCHVHRALPSHPPTHPSPAAIFLLGFGLVAVPRQLWASADPRAEQGRLAHQAGVQAEHAAGARRRLAAAVGAARAADVLFARHDPLRPHVDALLVLADSAGERAACCAMLCAVYCAVLRFSVEQAPRLTIPAAPARCRPRLRPGGRRTGAAGRP